MLKSIVGNIVSPDPTVRKLTFANFINTFGNGMFHTVGIIYFSFTVGLGAHSVAFAFTIGAAVSLAVSVPAGHLADKWSPKYVGIASFILQGIVLGLQVFTKTWSVFVILLCLEYFVERFGQNARMSYIAQIGEGQKRVEARAYMRAVTNLGIGSGTLIAGVALAINTPTAYKTMIALDALTFLFAALAYTRVPNVAPTLAQHEKFDWSVLKDHRYIIATALNGGLNLHFLVQNVAIPVWVVQETNAPRWMISGIMLMNTLAIVLFQVRSSKKATDIRAAIKLFQQASFYVALASLIYAMAHGVNALWASIIMLVGMAVHVAGELTGSNSAWMIAMDLADQRRQGVYQGIWAMGFGLTDMVGPSLLVALVIGIGQFGWVILAAWFLLIGQAMRFHLRNV
ncbi:MAG: MFS transporter [Candidatus Nanopelagicaceae bacterium]|jgi:MFS family permease